jgi:hypothetical protein
MSHTPVQASQSCNKPDQALLLAPGMSEGTLMYNLNIPLPTSSQMFNEPEHPSSTSSIPFLSHDVPAQTFQLEETSSAFNVPEQMLPASHVSASHASHETLTNEGDSSATPDIALSASSASVCECELEFLSSSAHSIFF